MGRSHQGVRLPVTHEVTWIWALNLKVMGKTENVVGTRIQLSMGSAMKRVIRTALAAIILTSGAATAGFEKGNGDVQFSGNNLPNSERTHPSLTERNCFWVALCWI